MCYRFLNIVGTWEKHPFTRVICLELSEKYGKCCPLKMNFLYSNSEFDRLTDTRKESAWQEIKRRVGYMVLQVKYTNMYC